MIAGAGAGLLGEVAEITEDLLEEGQFLALGRGDPVDGLDLAPFFQADGPDLRDLALLVEGDDDDAALADLGLEKSEGFGALTDVVPDLVVENGRAGWRAQDFNDLVAAVPAGLDLRQALGVGQIPPRCHARRAGKEDRAQDGDNDYPPRRI